MVLSWGKEPTNVFHLQVPFQYSTQKEIKVVLCLIRPKHRNIKTQEEAEIQLHTFLSLPHVGFYGKLDSPAASTPWKKSPYPVR
jgi:hypothetical protein